MRQKFNNTRAGFTLVEIMIVVAIIALLAAIAVPNFIRARKRSQATRILNELRILNEAVDLYAIEHNKTTGNPFGWPDLQPYVKQGTPLYNQMFPTGINPGGNPLDVLGNTYRNATAKIDAPPAGCANISVNPKTASALADVAPDDFWSSYGIAPTP